MVDFDDGLAWKTFTKGQQPFGIAAQFDTPSEQRPRQAFFLRQKSQPRRGVGGDAEIWLVLQAGADFDFAIADDDGRRGRFAAGEGEMIRRIQVARRESLK